MSGMKNNSIRVKTLFYLILFSIFILLVLWGIQLVMSNFLYEKYQMRDVQKIAKEISNTDDEDLHDYLSEIVYKNAVCIEYINEMGVSTLYNDASTGCLLGRNNKILLKYKNDLISSGKDIKAINLVNKDYDFSDLLYGI